jgi:predicted RNase H-like HicB family nuclease
LLNYRQSLRFKVVNEIVFEVTQDADGGFCAECMTESIFTQGDTWEDLRANVKEAVEAFYFDRPRPAGIRLHLIRDEVFALG